EGSCSAATGRRPDGGSMWTCPQCGETHPDQFDACWKCAGRERPRPSAAPAVVEIRTLTSVLGPVVLGAVIGALLAGFVLRLLGVPGWEATGAGAALGALVGASAGIFLWAWFPFRDDNPDATDGRDR